MSYCAWFYFSKVAVISPMFHLISKYLVTFLHPWAPHMLRICFKPFLVIGMFPAWQFCPVLLISTEWEHLYLVVKTPFGYYFFIVHFTHMHLFQEKTSGGVQYFHIMLVSPLMFLLVFHSKCVFLTAKPALILQLGLEASLCQCGRNFP